MKSAMDYGTIRMENVKVLPLRHRVDLLLILIIKRIISVTQVLLEAAKDAKNLKRLVYALLRTFLPFKINVGKKVFSNRLDARMSARAFRSYEFHSINVIPIHKLFECLQ